MRCVVFAAAAAHVGVQFAAYLYHVVALAQLVPDDAEVVDDDDGRDLPAHIEPRLPMYSLLNIPANLAL